MTAISVGDNVNDDDDFAELEDEEESDLQEELPTRRRPGRPPKKPKPDEEVRTLPDFFSDITSREPDIRVRVTRLEPTDQKGFCGQFDGAITEQDIADRFGGGRYQVLVLRPRKQKNHGTTWEYLRSMQVVIAGEPKKIQHDKAEGATNGATIANESFVSHAMKMSHDLTRDAQERAARAEERYRSESVTQMEHVVKPYEMQLAAQSKQLENALTLLSRPPDHTAEERLLELYKEQNRDHSSRIESVRLAHDSELRALRQAHQDQLRLIETRHDNAILDLKRLHEREFETMRSSYERQLAAQADAARLAIETKDQTHSVRVETLKEQIDALKQTIRKRDDEISELRQRKDKSATEQMRELVELRANLNSLTEAPEGDGRSNLDRIVEIAAPIADGIAKRIQQPAALRPAPPRVVARPAADVVSVRRRDGSTITVPRNQYQRVTERMRAAQLAASAASAQPSSIDPMTAEIAIRYLENAYKARTEPAMVAASVANVVPADVIHYIKEHGVDTFMANHATLDDGSPLRMTGGKHWLRELARRLTAEPDEENDTALPSSPEES